MLLNIDLCDTLCEVQIFGKAPGTIVDTMFYDYLEGFFIDNICKKKSRFYAQRSAEVYIYDYLKGSEAATQWFIEQLYYDAVINRAKLCYEHLSELLVKLDDRAFIKHSIKRKTRGAVQMIDALLMHGTLDQVKWAFTMPEFMSNVIIESVICKVAKLETMMFIYHIMPKIFDDVNVRRIVDLMHDSRKVKRDLETLEYLVYRLQYKIDYYDSARMFEPSDRYAVMKFFHEVLDEGDESILEWVFIHNSDHMRAAVNVEEYKKDVLFEIATKCSHRLLRLFLDTIYDDSVHNDKRHAEAIKNLQYLLCQK